jgi:hypothetical protein
MVPLFGLKRDRPRDRCGSRGNGSGSGAKSSSIQSSHDHDLQRLVVLTLCIRDFSVRVWSSSPKSRHIIERRISFSGRGDLADRLWEPAGGKM